MNLESSLETLLRAVLAADDAHRQTALRVLQGDLDFEVKKHRGPLLLGVKEAAKLLGVSRATLWRTVQAGRLQKVELYPGSYRIRMADIERLVEGREPTAE